MITSIYVDVHNMNTVVLQLVYMNDDNIQFYNQQHDEHNHGLPMTSIKIILNHQKQNWNVLQ